MSAFGGKADIDPTIRQHPLMTQSGHPAMATNMSALLTVVESDIGDVFSFEGTEFVHPHFPVRP